jgi:hypothetical protein
MNALKRWHERMRGVPRVSPAGFLLYAASLLVFYGVLHLLGLRECVSLVCGTPRPVLGSVELGCAAGAAYIALYFGVAVFVPILLIAAAVMAVLMRLLARRRPAGVVSLEPRSPSGV